MMCITTCAAGGFSRFLFVGDMLQLPGSAGCHHPVLVTPRRARAPRGVTKTLATRPRTWCAGSVTTTLPWSFRCRGFRPCLCRDTELAAQRPRPTGPAPTGKPAQARAAGCMAVDVAASMLAFSVLQEVDGVGRWPGVDVAVCRSGKGWPGGVAARGQSRQRPSRLACALRNGHPRFFRLSGKMPGLNLGNGWPRSGQARSG